MSGRAQSGKTLPTLGKLTLILGSGLFVLVLAELALWLQESSADAGRDHREGAAYTLSMYATDGVTSLSNREGRLKLILDPFVTYRNLPNQDDPWFHINSRGYRGPEPNLSPAIRRIALLGGSAAFGTGASSDEHTVAAEIEKRLDGVQVINSAVNGHVSTDELILLRTELIDLDLSAVVALDGFNDSQLAYVLSGERTQANSVFHDLEGRLIKLQRIRAGLLSVSLAWCETLLPRVYGQFARLEKLPGYYDREVEGTLPDDRLDAKIKIYTSNIRKMAATAEQHGLPFLVVLQPQRHTDWKYGEYYAGRYNLFVETVSAALPPTASTCSIYTPSKNSTNRTFSTATMCISIQKELPSRLKSYRNGFA